MRGTGCPLSEGTPCVPVDQVGWSRMSGKDFRKVSSTSFVRLACEGWGKGDIKVWMGERGRREEG